MKRKIKSNKILHIYTRVSSQEQTKGHSLDVQKQKGIQKAEELGYSYEVFIEEGKSANFESLDNRPALTELIEKCKKGEVTDLWVLDFDRLTRNLRLFIELERIFEEHDIILHTLSATHDLDDPEQRFNTVIHSVFSEFENKKRILKIKHSLKQAVVVKNRWIGVNVPYGYRKGFDGALEIDPEEREIYLRMVEMTLKGCGTNSVAKELNRLAVSTKGSKVLKSGIHLPKNKDRYHERYIAKEDLKWSPNTIRSIILNPLYKGERRFHDELLPVPHLAIIDSETWEKLQVKHKNNKNHSRTERKHFYLLKGLLRCSHCQRNLVGRIKTDENYYQCSSKRVGTCELRSPNITMLDRYVWSTVLSFPATARRSAQIALNMRGAKDIDKMEGRVVAIEIELRKVESRLKNLVLLFETERIDLNEFDVRKADLMSEKQRLVNEQKDVEAKKLVSPNSNEDRMMQISMELGNPRFYMKDLSDTEKQEVLRNVVENIEVNWVADLNAHTVKIHLKMFDMNYTTTGIMQKGTNNKRKIQDSPESVLKTLYWTPQ